MTSGDLVIDVTDRPFTGALSISIIRCLKDNLVGYHPDASDKIQASGETYFLPGARWNRWYPSIISSDKIGTGKI
mgnify:CR=1 FL=1